jgi:hypothetical protein
MVEALVDILPGLEVEIELAAHVGKVAGEIGEYYGHSHYDVYVVLVELEETAEGFDAPTLFIKLYAN